MATIMNGHPRVPETFEFTETISGPDGYRRTIRSYVAWDSTWPWWKKALAFVLAKAALP